MRRPCAGGLFRRHVGWGSQYGTVLGQFFRSVLTGREPEVHHMRQPFFVNHDVGRLDVPVDYAHFVCVSQCFCEVADESGHLVEGQEPLVIGVS